MDLEMIEDSTDDGEGVGVFDYGEMPDKIEGKGDTLCSVGAYNFYLLMRVFHVALLFNYEIIKYHLYSAPDDA